MSDIVFRLKMITKLIGQVNMRNKIMQKNKKQYYKIGIISFFLFLTLMFVIKYYYTGSDIPYFDSFFQRLFYPFQENKQAINIAIYIIDYFGGSIGVILCTIIIALLFFLVKDRVGALWLSIISIVTFLVNTIFNNFVGRIRPSSERLAYFATEWGMSFPSGHSAFITIIIGSLLLIFIQKKYPKIWVIVWLIFGVSLIALTMFSCIITGLYYPSDTIGGLFLGVTGVCLTFPIFQWLHYSQD